MFHSFNISRQDLRRGTQQPQQKKYKTWQETKETTYSWIFKRLPFGEFITGRPATENKIYRSIYPKKTRFTSTQVLREVASRGINIPVTQRKEENHLPVRTVCLGHRFINYFPPSKTFQESVRSTSIEKEWEWLTDGKASSIGNKPIGIDPFGHKQEHWERSDIQWEDLSPWLAVGWLVFKAPISGFCMGCWFDLFPLSNSQEKFSKLIKYCFSACLVIDDHVHLHSDKKYFK